MPVAPFDTTAADQAFERFRTVYHERYIAVADQIVDHVDYEEAQYETQQEAFEAALTYYLEATR